MVSALFGLSQGGIVPGYAIVIREYMAPQEAGRRVGIVMMSTTLGMALGGWMSGWIYDLTGSYSAAFLNGIAWNLLNLLVMMVILCRSSGVRWGAAPSLAWSARDGRSSSVPISVRVRRVVLWYPAAIGERLDPPLVLPS